MLQQPLNPPQICISSILTVHGSFWLTEVCSHIRHICMVGGSNPKVHSYKNLGGSMVTVR